jgi:hypothetical protein
VSTPKDKKNALAGEQHRRPKRMKEKLIRLDDLIPQGNVVGGRQFLFGVTYTTQTNNPQQQETNMAEKKNTKVRDMKPSKDAKGGGGGKTQGHGLQGHGLQGGHNVQGAGKNDQKHQGHHGHGNN